MAQIFIVMSLFTFIISLRTKEYVPYDFRVINMLTIIDEKIDIMIDKINNTN